MKRILCGDIASIFSLEGNSRFGSVRTRHGRILFVPAQRDYGNPPFMESEVPFSLTGLHFEAVDAEARIGKCHPVLSQTGEHCPLTFKKYVI